MSSKVFEVDDTGIERVIYVRLRYTESLAYFFL